MVDTKISGFTDGATAVATDRLAALRSPFGTGDDRWLTPTYIKDYILGLANAFSAIQTFTAGIAMGAGATFDADFAAASTTGTDVTQSATVTKATGTITTAALTTAAAGSTAVVLTLTGVVADDPIFVTLAGGTNTRTIDISSAIATTNTLTITIKNVDLVNALNGTVKFHYFWMKA